MTKDTIGNLLLKTYTVLTSFLLFLVEVYLGKYFLPYFGGSSSVWNICLVFFTSFLFLAYLYAYCLSRFKARTVLSIHISLGVISIILGLFGYYFLHWFTPITGGLPQIYTATPELQLIWFLTCSIGLLYIFLGSTSIIIQKFYYESYNKNPYYLYNLSNLGSLVGLLSFPFFLEDYFTLKSIGILFFIVYAAVNIILGLIMFTYKNAESKPELNLKVDKEGSVENISIGRICYWIMISFASNALLLSTINYIGQYISPLPILWVFSLAAFLLSFILGFKKIGRRQLYVISFLSLAAFFLFINFVAFGFPFILFYLYLTCIFAALNNRLYESCPNPAGLSRFYLCIVLGGALGTLVFAFIPQYLFNDYYEIPLIIFFCWLLISRSMYFSLLNKTNLKFSISLVVNGIVFILLVTCGFYFYQLQIKPKGTYSVRNFYGVLKVTENDGIKSLINGNIIHGTENAKDSAPTTYYSKSSGIGQALQNLQSKKDSISIGVIGLGTGTLSSYCRENDSISYYEINSADIDIAKNKFNYLKHCSNTTIYQGDARLLLDDQKRDTSHKKFDVLVVDAFTGDAIPYHLITRESVQLYKNFINDGGIIAFNISNKYLDLNPVVKGLASNASLEYISVFDMTRDKFTDGSEWVLLSADKDLISNFRELFADKLKYKLTETNQSILWTDDYSSVWKVMKF